MLSDPKKTKDEIVQWIRDYFEENGPDCSAVIGISGGKDSIQVIKALGIPSMTVNISGAYSKLIAAVGAGLEGGTSEQTKVNLPPRLRMATLYAVAQSLPSGGRVVNTCNMSEDFVGYSTKFGDSAGDFSPLANLMVHGVRQIGYELPVPKELVDKTPADGLCGKTDEDNLGFTYAQLDSFIENGTCGIMSIDHTIQEMHRRNLHKLRPMPAFGEQK